MKSEASSHSFHRFLQFTCLGSILCLLSCHYGGLGTCSCCAKNSVPCVLLKVCFQTPWLYFFFLALGIQPVLTDMLFHLSRLLAEEKKRMRMRSRRRKRRREGGGGMGGRGRGGAGGRGEDYFLCNTTPQRPISTTLSFPSLHNQSH